MNERLKNLPNSWKDSDDAPELSQDFFIQGDWKVGRQAVSMSEGMQALNQALAAEPSQSKSNKQSLTLNYDADIIAAFKASGKGWQTRMNDALREWLNTHSLTARPTESS